MSETGIIRRIDDLGRIVIPRHIRTVLRIHEGDAFEMSIQNGGVFIKKYSLIKTIGDFAQCYTDSLYKTIGHVAIITDTEKIIAISGLSKSNYLMKTISESFEEVIRNIRSREIYLPDKPIDIIDNQPNVFNNIIIASIIADGDLQGSVILANENINRDFGEVEHNLVKQASLFIAKQMEC